MLNQPLYPTLKLVAVVMAPGLHAAPIETGDIEVIPNGAAKLVGNTGDG